MVDRKLLRLSMTLLFIGQVLVGLITRFVHPGGGPTEQATFALNAARDDWTAIHLGQFFAWVILLAGLLVLFFALNPSEGIPRWVGFFGATSVGVTLALCGLLFALDGIANKQEWVAWVNAPEAEKTARLASAEAIRWLEWGITSYQILMFGLALVLFGIVIVWTGRVARLLGYVMGLSGIAWFVLSWVIGTGGFTSAQAAPTNVGFAFLLASTIWLLVAAWRMREAATALPPKPATL